MSKTKAEKADTFEKGDVVKARWSGSNVFYDAKVVSVTSRTYKVQFDDGSISSVKYADVKKSSGKSDTEPSPPKPAAKPRSRSRSGGRQTRSRSRSPARKGRPAKKTTPKESKKKASPSPKANSSPKDEVDSVGRSSLSRRELSSSPKKTPIVVTNNLTKESNITLRKRENSTERRSTRLAAQRTQERVSSSVSTRRSKAFSDDEEEEQEKRKEHEGPSVFWQFLLVSCTFARMAIVPASLLFLTFSCTKKQCTILDVPQFYARPRDMLNALKLPLLFVFGFHLCQCIFSLLPIGKKAEGVPSESKSSVPQYRMSGIFSLIVCLIAFVACTYFGVYMNWGYDKFKGFALASLLYSTAVSLGMHLYATVRGDGTTHSKIPVVGNFYNGSYVNPVLFNKLDLKTSLIRTGLIGSVLLSLSILVKFFLMKGFLTVPMALTAGMQLFFVLDIFIREEKLLTTATYTSDTVGYGFILSHGFMVPVGLSLQVYYLFIQDSKLDHVPHWCSASMVALFLVGYYIYLISSNLKHNFRRNPFSLTMSDVASIPTSKKKRLIASGWWGRCRHPNYLGLLIMATAWTLPCGFSHALPFGPLALLVIALVVRCFRIEADCKTKYGPAWDNYTSRVRSRLIPYIF